MIVRDMIIRNGKCYDRDAYQQGRADARVEYERADIPIIHGKAELEEHDAKVRADAIDEFDRICEEARSHKFGVCDAEFVIDVIKAKVKEQLKEKKNG